MSVLIRGMEMPKSCGYCPLRHEARDGDECYLGASLTEYQKRPEDCPIVPVPAHGRLIDADEMRESVRKQSSFLKIMGGKLAEIAETLEKGFLQEIANAPTIIQAEPFNDLSKPCKEEGE